MTDKHSNLYAPHLKKLKEKLDNQAMSVLIGAGFSKNFNKDVFPSWWELIFGMVREGQETELSDRYLQLFPTKRPTGKVYEIWLRERIEKHIENIGPLEAVSEFIRRKGYREAVDVRIEQQTPVIEVADGERYIRYIHKGKPVRRLVRPDELRLHQKLVQLPWNNIYTTNYDNLLEKSVDLTIAKDFRIAISELKDVIARDQQTLDGKRQELAAIKMEFDVLTDRLIRSPVSKAGLPVDSGPATSSEEERLRELTPKKNTMEREIHYAETNVRQLDERLADLERNLGQLNSVVTHASQLAIKKTGNIIKIHGSVRTEEELEYGFDSNARMHYVISKEDFSNYPEKHEAFTQLMRISLLQESFCLLGFSGIDPNFLSWIGWVRDVIERKKATAGLHESKIYLIDVGQHPAELEKSLFHLNHRIAFIPLGHSDCIEYLEEQTGKKLGINPGPRELVEVFLDYLSTDVPSHIQIAFEQFQQERYNKLWQRSSWSVTPSGTLDNFHIFNHAPELARLNKYNRIPSNAHHLFDRYETLQSLPSRLEQLKHDPGQLRQLISFVAQLLSEQYLSIRNIFDDDALVIKELIGLAKTTGHPQYGRLLLAQLKDAVWSNDQRAIDILLKKIRPTSDEEVKQELAYLKTLHAFFNLQFTKAEQELAAWEANGHWVVKKAGLLMLIAPSAAMDLLQSLRLETVQETIYLLQLLAFGSLVIGKFEQRTKYVKQYRDILHEGLNDTTEQLDQLLEKLGDKVPKVVPYGDDKFTNTRTINFGGGNEWAFSLMFFGLLADLGFPLSMPRLTFYDSAKVHPALFMAFPNIPYPVLFYLFQYSDEKLSIKLAQDYATNEKVTGEIPRIFENIKALYHDERAIDSFRQNGLHFLSELINVIEPEIWEPFFVQVWKDLLAEGSLLAERHFVKNHFVEKALHLFQLSATAEQVIQDLLMAVIINEKQADTTAAIRYLYELNFNATIKKQGQAGLITLDGAAIKTLTQALSDNLDLMFVLGNLNFAMSDAQRQAITTILQKASQLSSSNERIWRIILYFANNNEKIVQAIKTSILESSRLWDAGFTPKGMTSSDNYISLYQLRKRGQNLGLSWTPAELSRIYAKLKETLPKIESWIKLHDQFSDFKAIAEEMAWFINAEQDWLSAQDDFHDITDRVNRLLVTEKNYDRLMDGLLSNEKNEVTGAINDLSYQLYNFRRFDLYTLEIKTVLNKVLLQMEPGLAEALGTAADWFYIYRGQAELRPHSNLLLAILQQYQKRMADKIDQPYLEAKLIGLALVLRAWKIDHGSINHYLGLLKNSRFMEIRYNLEYQLDND